MRLWDNPAQAVVGVVVVAAAVLVLVTRRRLTAVMLVGVTGYGDGDALRPARRAGPRASPRCSSRRSSLVVFVLVLRRLPTKFTRHPHSPVAHVAHRARRSPSARRVGASRSSRRAAARRRPSRSGFPTEAYEFGHGRNIVNVTLVDIRAWDTLGEVSVLVVAATGIASLIFVRTRNTRLSAAPPPRAAVDRRRAGARGCTVAGRCARRSARSSSRW